MTSVGASVNTSTSDSLPKMDERTRQSIIKWPQVKVELKVKMAHWKPEWQAAAEKWIEATVVEAVNEWSKYLTLTVRFPNGKVHQVDSAHSMHSMDAAGSVEKFKLLFSPKYTSTQFGDETGSYSRYSSLLVVDRLTKYYQSAFHRQEHDVPLNLLCEIIFHIVNAFEGKLSYYHPKKVADDPSTLPLVYRNYLHFDKQHLFPGFALAPEQSSPSDLKDLKTLGTNVESGWTYIDSDTIVSSDKLALLPSYQKELIDKLCAYQITRLIDCHFGNFGDSGKFGNSSCGRQKLLSSAHRFADNLKLGRIRAPKGSAVDDDCFFLEIKSPLFKLEATFTTLQKLLISSFYEERTVHYGIYLSFSPKFSLHDEKLIQVIGDLTPHDLDTIIRIVLEVHFCGLQLRQIIDAQDTLCATSSDKFPTAMDHFASFDEPLLRGLLTKTSAARKLADHARNVETLRQGCMESSASVPTAVTSLMESYLTPLL